MEIVYAKVVIWALPATQYAHLENGELIAIPVVSVTLKMVPHVIRSRELASVHLDTREISKSISIY